MISLIVYLVLIIVILHFQLKVSTAYYSHSIKADLSSLYMPLSDYYFDFKDVSTLRNLNSIINNTNMNNLKQNPKTLNNQTWSIHYRHKNITPGNDSDNINYKKNKPKAKNFRMKRNLASGHQQLEVKYSQILQFDIYRDWVNEILLPYIYEDNNGDFLNQNFIVGDPDMNLGMRFVNATENLDNSSNKVIYYTIPAKEYTIFDKIGDEIATKPRVMYYSDGIYDFIDQGNFTTFYGAGGFLFPYPKDRDTAYSLYYLYESDIVEVFWVNLYFTFLLFNRNNKNMILNVLEFDSYPSGEYVPKFYYYTIRQFYSTPLDYFRLALEILFLIMSSWFSYLTLKKLLFYIYSQFTNTNKKKEKNKNKKQKKSNKKMLLKSLKSDMDSSKNYCSVFFKLFVILVFIVIKFIFSVIIYVFKNINNCIDVASMIISFILVSQWIKITTEDLFIIEDDGKAPHSMEYVNVLQKYLEDYRLMCIIAIILWFLKLLKFLKFSYKFSIFYETIKASGKDLIFFSVSLILIILGYSMVGNLLFGMYQLNFKYLHYAFISIFELLWGGYYLEYIVSYNKTILYIYGLSFTFTVIIVLNMMIAIILSHYFEYYGNIEDLDANFIKLFLKNFISKESFKNQTKNSGTLK